MKAAKRICIYPKDIAILTGKSERYGRRILERIRLEYQKEPHQVVTINEFCQYMGMPHDDVSKMIDV